jgi:RNA polymerase sigma factor (sigma-70 family)
LKTEEDRPDAQSRKAKEDNEFLSAAAVALQRQFEELRARTEPYVRARVARNAGPSRADEDDIVETAFEQIWRAIPSFDPSRGGKPVSWFMTVVDHAVAGYFRKTKKFRPVALFEQMPDDRPKASALEDKRQEAFAALCGALSRLEPAWRDILLLTAMYPDMDYSELAKAVGAPNVQAARQLKYRAVIGIRRILKEMGVGYDILALIYR